MTEAGSKKTQTNPHELAVIADGYDSRLQMGIERVCRVLKYALGLDRISDHDLE